MVDSFGVKDGRLYVNSATGHGVEWVRDRFPEAAPNGSIPMTLVALEVIPGNVAIRKIIEQELGVGTKRARALLAGAPFDDWRGVPLTYVSSLTGLLDAIKAQTAEGEARSLQNLQRGRTDFARRDAERRRLLRKERK